MKVLQDYLDAHQMREGGSTYTEIGKANNVNPTRAKDHCRTGRWAKEKGMEWCAPFSMLIYHSLLASNINDIASLKAAVQDGRITHKGSTIGNLGLAGCREIMRFLDIKEIKAGRKLNLCPHCGQSKQAH